MKDKISEFVLLEVVKAEKEQEFLELLKEQDVFTEEELKAISIMISYFRILYYPKLKEAMKTALVEELYKKFNEERKVKNAS